MEKKERIKKTGLAFQALLDSGVALVLTGAVGFGMYFSTRYLIGYNEAGVLLHTIGVTAAAGMWLGMKIQKEYFRRAEQYE